MLCHLPPLGIWNSSGVSWLVLQSCLALELVSLKTKSLQHTYMHTDMTKLSSYMWTLYIWWHPNLWEQIPAVFWWYYRLSRNLSEGWSSCWQSLPVFAGAFVTFDPADRVLFFKAISPHVSEFPSVPQHPTPSPSFITFPHTHTHTAERLVSAAAINCWAVF